MGKKSQLLLWKPPVAPPRMFVREWGFPEREQQFFRGTLPSQRSARKVISLCALGREL